MNFKSVNKLKFSTLLLSAALVLNGCGGASDSVSTPDSKPVVDPSTGGSYPAATDITYDVQSTVLTPAAKAQDVTFTVLNKGVVVPNTQITITTTDKIAVSPAVLTTDASGKATVNVSIASSQIPSYIGKTVSISAAVPNVSQAASIVFSVQNDGSVAPTTPATLSVQSSKVQLTSSGDTADITVKVLDNNGVAVAGQVVQLDPNQVGNVANLSATQTKVTSDASGQVKFTVSLANTLKGGATKVKVWVSDTISAIVDFFIQLVGAANSSAILSVTSNKDTLEPAGDTATVSFKAVDANGGVLKNVRVDLKSNHTALTFTGPSSVVTGDTGQVTTSVQFAPGTTVPPSVGISANLVQNDGTAIAGVSKTFVVRSSVAIPARIAVLQDKSTLTSGGDTAQLTFKVLDDSGLAIPNAKVGLKVGAGDEAISLTAASLTSDASGLVKVGVDLANNKLDYLLDQDVNVTATALDPTSGLAIKTETANFSVTGTKLSLENSAPTVDTGANVTFTLMAVNGKATAIAGAGVDVYDANSDVKLPLTGLKTGSDGKVAFRVNEAELIKSAGTFGVYAQLKGETLTQKSAASMVKLNSATATKPQIIVYQTTSQLVSGGDTGSFTLKVIDENGGVQPGVTVKLLVADPAQSGATLTTASTLVTDDKGLVSSAVDLQASSLEHVLNHPVKVTAQVFDAKNVLQDSKDISFLVQGTTLSLTTRNSVLNPTSTAMYDVLATDGRGKVIKSANVCLYNKTSNAQIVCQATDAGGKAVLSAAVGGQSLNVANQLVTYAKITSTLNSSYEVVSADNYVDVNQIKFAFESITTAEQPVVTQSADNTLDVAVLVKGDQQSKAENVPVTMTTTLGQLEATTVNSGVATFNPDGSGLWVAKAVFKLKSTSPGLAVLTAKATIDGKVVQVVKTQEFVSTVATAFTFNIEQSVVTINGATKLYVAVRDVNNAPVKNVRVLFQKLSDPSGGALAAAEAITDRFGQASVVYNAGANRTPMDGVVLKASLPDFASIAAITKNLTVVDKAIQILIGSANKLATASFDVYYEQNMSVQVLDGSSRPVANQVVSLRSQAERFYKGRFTPTQVQVNGSISYQWGIMNYTECQNEDTISPVISHQRNGLLDSDEDRNGNGLLDISTVASILDLDSQPVSQLTTDADGQFNFKIRYMKKYAQWLEVTVLATSAVSGSESFARTTFDLPILDADVPSISDTGVPSGTRSNLLSPFGYSQVNCTSYD